MTAIFGCNNSNPVSKDIPEPTYVTDNIRYKIIIIDSCEYILGDDMNPYGGHFLTHKGNCKNPIHKKQ